MAHQNDTTDSAPPNVPLAQWYAPGVVAWRSVAVPSVEWVRMVEQVRRIDTVQVIPSFARLNERLGGASQRSIR